MKDAYYFQHDANARHDPKLIMLRKEHGIAGIGRWWILVEILREQENYTFDIGLKHNLRALRHELEFANDDELIAFLNDLNEFSLIVNLDGIIFSPALLKRMKRLDEIRAKKQIAGQKSGESRRTKSEPTCYDMIFIPKITMRTSTKLTARRYSKISKPGSKQN